MSKEIQIISEQLSRIEYLLELLLADTRETITADEACKLLSIKKSTLYHYTHKGIIPSYKPTNKLLFFKRTELEEWMTTNKLKNNSSHFDIDKAAEDYLNQNPINH